MNTNKFVTTVGLMSLMISAVIWHADTAAQDIRNSVITVDELLKIDNAQALEKARSDAIAGGLMQSPRLVGQKVEVPLPHWTVRSVFGLAGSMAADLTVNGSTAYSVTPGNSVAMCKVMSIQKSCVGLAPLDVKVRKVSCPSKVCWTGNELTSELRPSQAVSAVPASTKLASSPLPAPPIPLPAGSDTPISMPFPPR